MEKENQRALLPFLKEYKTRFPNKDLWVFTGFLLDEDLSPNGQRYTEVTDELLSLIDILIDGRFKEELKDITLQFRGSSNQRVIDMNETRKNGKITIYFSEGEFTDDNIEKEFFGCGGVAKIDNLQDKLIKLARGGFKHHTTVANGHVKNILEEAFKYYLGYDVVSIED